MKTSSNIVLGYSYDDYYAYGIKTPIVTDVSSNTNTHSLICGMSGSGKSYYTNLFFARLCFLYGNNIQIYFADFKQDEAYKHLRGALNYFPYEKSLEALDIVYGILHGRQSGKDISRTPVVLIWDEYMANVLAIKAKDKKKAELVMGMVSEILMLGRSLGCNICITTQTAYASVFPEGSRANFGIIVIQGAPVKSIYEMLIPKEYIEKIGDRKFKRGEGIVLLQGTELHFIKTPTIRDEKKLQEICIRALGKR